MNLLQLVALAMVIISSSCQDLRRHLVAFEIFDEEGNPLDNAEVYFDGILVGSSDSQGQWIQDMVLNDKISYEVEVRKPDLYRLFAIEKRTYSIKDDKIVRVYLSSIPLGSPAAESPQVTLAVENAKDQSLPLLDLVENEDVTTEKNDITIYVLSEKKPVLGAEIYFVDYLKEEKLCSTNIRGRCFLKGAVNGHYLVHHRAFKSEILKIEASSKVVAKRVNLQPGTSVVFRASTRDSGTFTPLDGVKVKNSSSKQVGTGDHSGIVIVPVESYDQSLTVVAPKGYIPKEKVFSQLLSRHITQKVFFQKEVSDKIKIALRPALVTDESLVNPSAVAKLYRHLLLSPKFALAEGGYEVELYFDKSEVGAHLYNFLSHHVSTIRYAYADKVVNEEVLDRFYEKFVEKFPMEYSLPSLKSAMSEQGEEFANNTFNTYHVEEHEDNQFKLKLKEKNIGPQEVSSNLTGKDIAMINAPEPYKIGANLSTFPIKYSAMFPFVSSMDHYVHHRFRLIKHYADDLGNLDLAVQELTNFEKDSMDRVNLSCKNWNVYKMNKLILNYRKSGDMSSMDLKALKSDCLEVLPLNYRQFFQILEDRVVVKKAAPKEQYVR
jgi:hypothetical protein